MDVLTDVRPVLRDLDQRLIALLRTLTPDEWQRPTTARRWAVRDIAAHLLDGNLRTLSMLRDGYAGDPPGEIRSYEDLLAYLNRLNADWVQAARRLSPAVLTEWLASSGQAYLDYVDTLALDAPAAFAVAWAGEAQSANWFHLAREYTEKWHHQQQIRLATGRATEELLQPDLFSLLIETLLRALPHQYRAVPGRVGDALRLTIEGPGGGEWFLRYRAAGWQLERRAEGTPLAHAWVPDGIVWRLFMKSIDPEEARPQVRVTGAVHLIEPLFGVRAVMA
jgi:uncharacterized protein (TIGR03083 family)